MVVMLLVLLAKPPVHQCCHRKWSKTTTTTLLQYVLLHEAITCVASRAERAMVSEEASARKRRANRVPATQRPGCHGTADTAGPRRMGTPRRAGWLAMSHAGKRSKSQLLRGETRDRTPRVRRVENAALRISIEQPPFSPTHPLGDVGGCAKDVATYQHGAVVKFDSFARPPRSARVPLAANNPQCTPCSSSHPS